MSKVLTYPEYLKKYSIRLLQQLQSPPLHSLAVFNLPRGSALHFLSTDYEDIGIQRDDSLLQNHDDKVAVSFISGLVEGHVLGNPRKASVSPLQDINAYISSTKFLNLDRNKNAGNMERTLVVYNYGLLNRVYIYRKEWDSAYNQWRNNFSALVDKLKQVVVDNRQNFIVLETPGLLPPPVLLNKSEDMSIRSISDRFNTDSLRTVSELWNWLGFSRDVTALSTLTQDELNKVNLILVHGGMWTVVNLGLLNSWRKASETDKAPGFSKIDPVILQKRFLRMLMTINESSTGAMEKEEYDELAKDSTEETIEDDSSEDSEGNINTVKNKISDHDFSVSGGPDINAPYGISNGKKPVVKSTLQVIKQGIKDNGSNNDKEIVDEIGEIDDASVDDDLNALDKLEESFGVTEVTSVYSAYMPPADDLVTAIELRAKEAVASKHLSAAEYRRIVKLSTRYKEIKDPFDANKKLADALVIPKEDLEVPETNKLVENIPGVTDKSMLSASTKVLDSKYIEKVFRKDIMASFLNLQKSDVIIQDYSVEKVEDLLDNFEIHTVRVVPIIGKPTTLRFKVPVINEDGTFKAGGVKYRMRRQKGDIPIRKTAPDTVAMTSYYSKMFVVRSSRAIFNYDEWLPQQVISRGINTEDTSVTDVRMNNVFNPDMNLPRAYTILARKISGFTTSKYQFMLDWDNRKDYITDDLQKAIDNISKIKLVVPVGTYPSGILLMDYDNIVYTLDSNNMQSTLGTIESLIGADKGKIPTSVAEVGIFGSDIPLGFILAYVSGLGSLLATLGVAYRKEPVGSNYNLTEDEYIIKFADEALILPKSNKKAGLLLAGFNKYHREIKRHSLYAFDKKEVYSNILEEVGLGVRYVREFKNMFKLWVDPITKGLLEEMKEPTDLFGLFLSATEKLLTDKHPDQMDDGYMRYKGYERISGMLYFELIKAMRVYNSRPSNANASVDLNPEALWMSILQDQTVMPIEESNPIHSLKEKEVVIFSGAGGRTSRSMTEKSRIYHESAMGVVSEATVDSGDVATIVYLSADPNFNSVRGTTRRTTEYVDKSAKMVSTSMLLAPSADRDDPKRINFISVQNSQTTFCTGYKALPVRTGYERVLAHRTDSLFAKTAAMDGIVDNITDKVISIKYTDGSVKTYELGKRFGTWAGSTIPQPIVTNLAVGKKVKKGDVICYNTNYFQQDALDSSQVIFKAGVLARTMMCEITDTIEDSSALTERLAKELITRATEVRYVTVRFDQEIRNLLSVGEDVDPETILCTLHTASSGNTDIYDEKSLDTLALINTPTPKAKYKGTIDKIDVLYTGEMDDMSLSLRHLAEASDNKLRKFNKQMGGKAIDGRVDVGYRADGKPMELDSAVIKIYITTDVSMKGGDKIVFGNQMKSVSCRIMSGDITSADGKPIDAKFAQQSITNRIARSFEVIGTTTTLALLISDAVVKAYYE